MTMVMMKKLLKSKLPAAFFLKQKMPFMSRRKTYKKLRIVVTQTPSLKQKKHWKSISSMSLKLLKNSWKRMKKNEKKKNHLRLLIVPSVKVERQHGWLLSQIWRLCSWHFSF